MSILNRIKELYDRNSNILKYLRNLDAGSGNSVGDIAISYDFQAGVYTEAYKKDPAFRNEFGCRLAKIIQSLGHFSSLLEVGVGEATTLGPTLKQFKAAPKQCYGFDISWSRIKYARKFLSEIDSRDIELFVGDLFRTPLKNNSIEIVYTNHSIEPNGGNERAALEELYRITNKYLILLEPSYEFADEQARNRMIEHGYITNLYATAKELGYDIIEHRLFDISVNPLNPTGLMIIQKQEHGTIAEPLCCPITKTDLIRRNHALFSPESLLAYPIIDDIPCLLQQNAIVATKFLDNQ
ncbi:methyltransferase domain-containing protein [Ferviditalea candida]|uniref:Methyltransferase domain-containing protein n=1 Tax=Ferviditalea candida TaxID=3108399 RepID=A0ABU5ZIB4_9BACL|nr:methyltransferase domain-containing protein [Paenibacillaceae bacterium T2]